MSNDIFSEELSSFIDEWWNKPGGLFLILKKVESEFGYISRDAVAEVAKRTRIYEGTIWGVVTHYNFYNTKSRGRHRMEICMTQSCYHKGSQKIMNELEDKYGIHVGSVTEDGRFSLEGMNCIGHCASGPVLRIDGKVFDRVTVEALPEILAEFE